MSSSHQPSAVTALIISFFFLFEQIEKLKLRSAMTVPWCQPGDGGWTQASMILKRELLTTIHFPANYTPF